MRVGRFPLLGLVAASLLTLPGLREAEAALAHPRSLHARVLAADVVFVARLEKASEPDGFGQGALYRPQVKEVLQGPLSAEELGEHRLSDLIPGASAIGHRFEVPEKVDALVFAVIGLQKRLVGINWCTNSVVPLGGTMDEITRPEGGIEEMTGAEFLKRVRAHVKEMGDPEYLRKAYRGARGSMKPYTAHDKGPLLMRLLRLDDPRVLPIARRLAREGVSASVQGRLDAYLAEHGGEQERKRLRAEFDELLAQHAAGKLDGTEMFVFANGSMRPKRQKVLRLLDAAAPLEAAGDAAYVAQRLLTLHRDGHAFADAYLLRSGVDEVFADLLRQARSWKGELLAGRPRSPALLRLSESRQRYAVLGVIRVAFAQENEAALRAVLEALRGKLGKGPGVEVRDGSTQYRSMEDQSRKQVEQAWRTWWQESSRELAAGLTRKTLDEVLGSDDTWEVKSR